MKQFFSALAIVIVLACCSSAAPAAPITFQFGGAVTSVDPLLAGTFAIGDPISEVLTFDSATSDSNPDPTIGTYQYISYQLQFGSYAVSLPPGAQSMIRVLNLSTLDLFQASDFAPGVGAAVNGLTFIAGETTLADSTHTAFNSDALPTSLNLGSFDFAHDTSLGFCATPANLASCVTNEHLVFGNILSVTSSVPEPATVVLLGLGLAGLGLSRRRQSR